MAANDEDLALQLHKQLNAIPLRARRGHGQELAHQQSLDRLKREKAKPRVKRTNSSSQDHPSSRKRRNSDPDDPGHTSAQQQAIKREPTDSNHSQPDLSEQQQQHGHQNDVAVKHCDSRDSGMPAAGGKQQQQQQQVPEEDIDPGELVQQHGHPLPAAAAYAAHLTMRHKKLKHHHQQQQHQHQQEHSASEGRVKVFYAGVRWSLSLPHNAVKSRQLLAKALNYAFVGEILSVGQGEGLTALFVDASNNEVQLGPTKWSSSSRSNSARWRALAKTATHIYVHSVR